MEKLLCRWQASRQAAVRYRTFPNADALLEEAQRERFTLYLLDVMMPGVDGMAAARAIREFDDAAQIVFFDRVAGIRLREATASTRRGIF